MIDLSPVSHLYYSVASNAWHRAKPIPLCRAGVYSRRLFRFKVFITAGCKHISLRSMSSLLRKHCPALRCNPIITQIGRENKFFAEILLLRTVEDACPYNFGLSKHPYENAPKSVPFSVGAGNRGRTCTN